MENQEGNNGPVNGSNNMDPKTLAIIAYITIVGAIVALVLNKDKESFASFHIRQGLGLGLTSVALSLIIKIVPFLFWFVGVAGSIILFILWLIGIMAALNGEEKLVPILGDKYQEWFKGL